MGMGLQLPSHVGLGVRLGSVCVSGLIKSRICMFEPPLARWFDHSRRWTHCQEVAVAPGAIWPDPTSRTWI